LRTPFAPAALYVWHWQGEMATIRPPEATTRECRSSDKLRRTSERPLQAKFKRKAHPSVLYRQHSAEHVRGILPKYLLDVWPCLRPDLSDRGSEHLELAAAFSSLSSRGILSLFSSLSRLLGVLRPLFAHGVSSLFFPLRRVAGKRFHRKSMMPPSLVPHRRSSQNQPSTH
jgi:hypothetical protein